MGPFFTVQNALKLTMCEIGAVISYIGKQDPFLAKQLSGDFPKDLVLFIKGGLGDCLAVGIDNLTAPPEPVGSVLVGNVFTNNSVRPF